MFDRYDDIAFVGTTLGPLFAHDPSDRGIADVVASFGALDVAAAASEWPFVAPTRARECLGLMREGASRGVDDGLVREYRRLFVGPAALPAPPWGSVYTDRECVVFGASTLALRAWMRERGIAATDGAKEPEDHIGRLLLMMAWIARERPDLTGEFLCDHVLTWSSHMLEQLEAASGHVFYRGLAALAASSLEGIGAAMGLKPEHPRFYR